MRRVAVLCEVLHPPLDEGVRIVASELAGALSRRVEVVLFGELDAEVNGLPVRGVLHDRFFAGAALARALVSERPDALLYVPWTSLTPRTFLRVAMLRRRLPGAPVGVLALQPRKAGALARLSLCFGRPDDLFAMGPEVVRQAEALGLGCLRLEGGVDLDRFRPLGEEPLSVLRRGLGLPASIYLVLHVGHLQPTRGVLALKSLQAHGGRWSWHGLRRLGGGGPEGRPRTAQRPPAAQLPESPAPSHLGGDGRAHRGEPRRVVEAPRSPRGEGGRVIARDALSAAVELALPPIARAASAPAGRAPRDGTGDRAILDLLRANKVPLVALAREREGGGDPLWASIAAGPIFAEAMAAERDRRATLLAEYRPVARALESSGARPVLHKTPAWFPYLSSNLDVLVEPGRLETSARVLAGLGHIRLPHYREDHKLLFRTFARGAPALSVHPHETASWRKVIVVRG